MNRIFFHLLLIVVALCPVGALRIHSQEDDGKNLMCKGSSALTTAMELQREFYRDYLGPSSDDPTAPRIKDGDSNELEITAEKQYEECVSSSTKDFCGKFKVHRRSGIVSSIPKTEKFSYDQDSCKILDEKGNEFDAIFTSDGNPIDNDGRVLKGYERAVWQAQYNLAKTKSEKCKTWNRGRKNDEPSFKEWLNTRENGKLKNFANLQMQAYGNALRPLEKFRKDNKCTVFLFKVPGLNGTCGESGTEARMVVEHVAASDPVAWQNKGFRVIDTAFKREGGAARTDLLNILLSNDGLGRIFVDASPFSMPQNLRSVERIISGNCNQCCSPEAISDIAYLYGGSDGLTIVAEKAVSLGCRKGARCGSTAGDPHLCSHDGLRFDFQGVGEYVLAKTNDFEVQVRYRERGKYVSINEAVAVKLKGDRVALYSGKPHRLTVNGKDFNLEKGDSIMLPGGAHLRRDERWFRVSVDGHALEASLAGGTRLSFVRVRVPTDSKSGGLFGDRNGKADDDIRTKDGIVISAPVTHEGLYKRFGDSWRVTQESSLFDYREGESVETFAKYGYPKRITKVSDFNVIARAEAEKVCKAKGLTDGVNLENCIYDVALTGDQTFADDNAGMPESGVRLAVEPTSAKSVQRTTEDGVTIEAPVEAIAAFPVNIKVQGFNPRYKLQFAEIGSSASSRFRFSGSSQLKSGGEIVSIRAPYRPGNYELRLVSAEAGNHQVLLRIPFRSTKPDIELYAADSARVGGSLDVRVVGDIASNSSLQLAFVGESEKRVFPTRRGLHGGLAETLTLPLGKKPPGNYEIRYGVGDGFVYARKAVTIRQR